MKTTTLASPSSVAPHMSIGVPCRHAFPWRSSVVALVSPYRAPCDAMIAIVFAPTCVVTSTWCRMWWRQRGAAQANKDSKSQRPDPRTQVTQVHGCKIATRCAATNARSKCEVGSRETAKEILFLARACKAPRCVTDQTTSEEQW